MRNKISLIIALAGFAVVTALGVGMAGAEEEGELTPSTVIETPQAAVEIPACANELDDDGDELIDLEDPECLDPEDETEEPEEEATEQPKAETPATPAPAIVAPPAPEAPAAQPELRTGTSLHASEAEQDGARRNGSIDATRAVGVGGGISAPPATGGDQPAADNKGDGGAEFSDGGSPAAGNHSFTFASFGPVPIGVPNFVIDSFEIPPFLLPIYQACGTEYGIPWEVLASINKIETAFGTNLNVSSAGAMGWMQFIPSSWEMYGLDANGDGRKDPYNPVDAICAAASYLKAAGGQDDLYKAIFAYNHADWYVQEVLLYAKAYGKLPTDLIGSLTGLTEGAHFPVAADSRYADDISTREALKDATPRERSEYGNAAAVISSSPTRRGINIFAAEGSPVVAVNDGVIIKTGNSDELGRFVVLRDAYGNRYTYAELGRIVHEGRSVVLPTGEEKQVPVDSENIRARLFAHPERGDEDDRQSQAYAEVDDAGALGADGTLEVGSKVIGGTVIGRVGGNEEGVDPHVNFSIRPAGRGAPRIDPKPILDGWKLLEATAIYRAKGKSPFDDKLGAAGVLLLSKSALERRVLADKMIEISECDRVEVRTGQIDRRVLATMAYLSERGFRIMITSMLCGRHTSITTSGNVSYHSFGNAIDIAMVNGIPIAGHQGPGSITNTVVKEIMRLQGTMVPDELISLEELGGPSFAMADHADHIHVGFSPDAFGDGPEERFVQLLKPDQWLRLTDRLGDIDNPEVPTTPSEQSLPDGDGGTAGD